MMMRGEIPLYEELKNKLLVQTAFVAIRSKNGSNTCNGWWSY